MSYKESQKKEKNQNKTKTGQTMSLQKKREKSSSFLSFFRVLSFIRKTRKKEEFSTADFEKITEEYKKLKTEISGNKKLSSKLEVAYGSAAENFLSDAKNKIFNFQSKTIQNQDFSIQGFERITEEYQKLKDDLSWNKDFATSLDTTYGSYEEKYQKEAPISNLIAPKIKGLGEAKIEDNNGGKEDITVFERDKTALNALDLDPDEKKKLKESYVGLFGEKETQKQGIDGIIDLFWKRNEANINGFIEKGHLPPMQWLGDYFPDFRNPFQFFTTSKIKGSNNEKNAYFNLLSELSSLCAQEYQAKKRIEASKGKKEEVEAIVMSTMGCFHEYWKKTKESINEIKNFKKEGKTWEIKEKTKGSPKEVFRPYVKEMNNQIKMFYEELYGEKVE